MASANASQQDPTIVSVNFCFASPSLHGTEMDTGGRAPAEISTGQVKVEACINPLLSSNPDQIGHEMKNWLTIKRKESNVSNYWVPPLEPL